MNHAPTPFKLAMYRDEPDRPPTSDEIKSFLCKTVDRTIEHGDNINDFYLVMVSTDADDPVFAAITGNGPHSKATAEFIIKACNVHYDLLFACKAQQELIADMMRFVGSMALRDYELLNRAPLLAKAAIAKAEESL